MTGKSNTPFDIKKNLINAKHLSPRAQFEEHGMCFENLVRVCPFWVLFLDKQKKYREEF